MYRKVRIFARFVQVYINRMFILNHSTTHCIQLLFICLFIFM